MSNLLNPRQLTEARLALLGWQKTWMVEKWHFRGRDELHRVTNYHIWSMSPEQGDELLSNTWWLKGHVLDKRSSWSSQTSSCCMTTIVSGAERVNYVPRKVKTLNGISGCKAALMIPRPAFLTRPLEIFKSVWGDGTYLSQRTGDSVSLSSCTRSSEGQRPQGRGKWQDVEAGVDSSGPEHL